MSSDLRKALVAAAEGWLLTPFHHAARLKGVGVDCANLLCAVYEEAGLIGHLALPEYSSDFMLHQSEERFLAGMLKTGVHEVKVPQPGDVAVFKYGLCYSHGAIVMSWPEVIHAIAALGKVVLGDATKYPLLDKGGHPRPVKFYSMLE